MEWFYKFPHMNDATLLALKKAIDGGFRSFTRAYGDAIESFLSPLQHFLIAADHFMTKTPWPIIPLIILAIAWGASRSVQGVAGCILPLLANSDEGRGGKKWVVTCRKRW